MTLEDLDKTCFPNSTLHAIFDQATSNVLTVGGRNTEDGVIFSCSKAAVFETRKLTPADRLLLFHQNYTKLNGYMKLI